MNKQIKVSFFFTLIATVGLGIIYPAVLAIFGYVIPQRPPTLLTQPIQNETLFHGRPSMSGGPYSGASNLSLTNPELWKQVDERSKAISKYPPKGTLIPRDLLFASASGYDPDISVQAALHQIPRVAQGCNMDMGSLRQLVDQHIQTRLWGFIGSEKVNVIQLNKTLEKIAGKIRLPAAPETSHIKR